MKDSQQNGRNNLNKSGTLRFKVDNAINPYAIFIKYYKNAFDKEFLYILCNDNQLLKFDYNTKTQISKLILEKEGPNGVGIANGMNIINEDSILITSKFYQKIFFIDSIGNLTKSVSFKNDSLYTSYVSSDFQHQVIFEDQKLIIPQNLAGNWNNISQDYYYNYKTLLKIDLISEKIEKFGAKLPFKSRDLLTPGYSYVKWNDLYIFSFFAYDNLIVIENNVVKDRIPAKSSNLGKLISTKEISNQSIETILRNKVMSGSYSNLIQDTTNHLLYRFYKIGNDNISVKSNLMEMNSFPQKFGIQVFDKNLELVSDNVFPEKKYFFNNSFMTSDGLLISSNHPDNPDFNIDYFTFDIFSTIK